MSRVTLRVDGYVRAFSAQTTVTLPKDLVRDVLAERLAGWSRARELGAEVERLRAEVAGLRKDVDSQRDRAELYARMLTRCDEVREQVIAERDELQQERWAVVATRNAALAERDRANERADRIVHDTTDLLVALDHSFQREEWWRYGTQRLFDVAVRLRDELLDSSDGDDDQDHPPQCHCDQFTDGSGGMGGHYVGCPLCAGDPVSVDGGEPGTNSAMPVAYVETLVADGDGDQPRGRADCSPTGLIFGADGAIVGWTDHVRATPPPSTWRPEPADGDGDQEG